MFLPKFKFVTRGSTSGGFAFFDRNVIRTRWPKFNKDPLQKAGNLVMRIARGSIRRRSLKRGKPSRPGTPPYSRRPGTTPPFKMIFSIPFHLGTSVIVGMVGFNSGGFNASKPVPGLHEHGGSARRYVFTNTGQRRSRRTGRFLKNRITYKTKMVKYPERPFMMPALKRARAVLPSLWVSSISHG